MDVLSGIRLGTRVRLQVAPDSLVEGKLLFAGGQNIGIRKTWSQSVVPADEVEMAWAWRGHAGDKAFVTGAAGALVVGVSLGSFLHGLSSLDQSEKSGAGQVIWPYAISAFIGFFLGATLGRAASHGSYHWDQVYPEE